MGNVPGETGTVDKNGLVINSKGGTELMRDRLFSRVMPEILNQVNIISSRVRDLDSEKPNFLWLHDLWNDPEAAHLKDPKSRERFAAFVFVSNWQMYSYNQGLGVPYGKSFVIKNGIDPIEDHKKPTDRINLIYHTTPHRGLQILIPVYQELYNRYGNRIHLDVYSSFDIYGWPERNKPYEPLFDICREHTGITYHGSRPNEEIREALKKAHIFAFPSIWQETSCLALIEAMSAGCLCVHSNLGALPETSGDLTFMYQYDEDLQKHAQIFYGCLEYAIKNLHMQSMKSTILDSKIYANGRYNIDRIAEEWNFMLSSFLGK